MQMSAIITQVFNLLKEATGGHWDNTELLLYGDACQEDMVKVLPLSDLLDLHTRLDIQKSGVHTDILLPSSGVYILPSDYVRFGCVAGKTSKINARKIQINSDEFKEYQLTYKVPSTNEPVFYFSKFVSDEVIVFSPNESYVTLLYYKQPTTFPDITATPQVNIGVHQLFVPYITYKALLADDELTLAAPFLQEYNEGVQKRGGS